MKKILLLSSLTLFVLASYAFALDQDMAKNYLSQIQSLQSEITNEQKTQQDLSRTKELILEGDKVNKEETAKLALNDAAFQADINSHKANKSAFDEDRSRFDAELETLKAQIDSQKESARQHNEHYAQHNSWTPDPYDHAGVDSYNAEANQLDAEAASINAQKDQYDAAKSRLVTWGENLDSRYSALEAARLELIERGKALDRKEGDLKWAREQLNKQTLKWAEDTKHNNARLDDLAAQLNGLLAKLSQMSTKCSSITGIGDLDLTNLNSASEQAVRCLQQDWDGASAGDSSPVAPVPVFKMTPRE